MNNWYTTSLKRRTRQPEPAEGGATSPQEKVAAQLTYGVDAVPLHLREANQFVARRHRHSLPTVGGKFALGAAQEGKLVGVAVAGRPVCRRHDDGRTLEV